ncbi:hypothetical protein OV450_6625 [Actinobacteria bacterium OV450]|nr:hypothetical protein OV450_6625 [Actinobacteria bacterium OV450]
MCLTCLSHVSAPFFRPGAVPQPSKPFTVLLVASSA